MRACSSLLKLNHLGTSRAAISGLHSAFLIRVPSWVIRHMMQDNRTLPGRIATRTGKLSSPATSAASAFPRRRVGRPKSAVEIERLIVTMAKANPGWGYTRIRGALYSMAHEIGRNTIKRILLDNGLEPAP